MLRNKNVHDASDTPERVWKTRAATGRKKAGVTTGKKKNAKNDPIEQSRKTAWGNCPSFNFSDFDSFDLVVETSSETKEKKDSLGEQSAISKTPLSSRGQQEKNVYRPNLLRTPQIPEIPKVNLHAMNAFSTSIGDRSLDSLPNSPALEICPSSGRPGYIHTSSPRVDSGFEADKSNSCNSSVDKCHLSHINTTPLADISAISNVCDDPSILENTSIDVPHMPSIDENSISDFSNIHGTNVKKDVNQRHKTNKMGKTASPVSYQQSSNHMSTCDISVNKQLDDMVKLTEQLSLMSATDNNNKIQGPITSHQTPKQYYTRQFAKSTQKQPRHMINQCNISKASSRYSSKAQGSLLERVATRNVTKSVHPEVSYDASQ